MAKDRHATYNLTESESAPQSVSQPRKKSTKGSVVVQVFKERLRLCWSHLGKRYFLYVGLPDNKVNRRVAELKAGQIELDLISGNFDSSLKKYKPVLTQTLSKTSVVGLFESFISYKSKTCDERTLGKYKAVLKYLQQFFRDKPVSYIGVTTAEPFVQWLGSQSLGAVAQKAYLTLIKACWDWALKNGITELNPWKDLVSRIRIPPKQMPRPFTKVEIEAIIQGFRSDRYYTQYGDFVEFLFRTGCRTSEAIGLRWRHLSDDCSAVWIGETISRGVGKPTKTNKARTVPLTPKLQAMLLDRKPVNVAPEDLVFPSARGGAIDDNNFRNRAWETVLTRLEIEYRKPYITRHTLISHALNMGMNPVEVAQLTGHDVKTLYQNYAGNVNSRPMLPEL